MNKRAVITGMGINTPIGDNLEDYFNNLVSGKSAITHWKTVDTSRLYAKIGGDLGEYDCKQKIKSLENEIPPEIHVPLQRMINRIPWFLSVSVLVAMDAWLDSGLFSDSNSQKDTSVILAGHNLAQNYAFSNHELFSEEPDFMDALGAVHGLDTSHLGCITEALDVHGAAYSVGGACASGNYALRSALDEIRYRGVKKVLIVAPLLDFSPMEIHGMTILEAISYKSFNDRPEAASRPYDVDREGFVPAHGTAAILLEDLEHASARGARIYAELLGVEASADANRKPNPSKEGQAIAIRRVLETCNVKAEEIDYVNAHATSTPQGDLCELESIKDALGKQAYKVKINATKSMLGHTCWSAALVETIAGVLQMQKGRLHPSINIDNIDPQVDLDVCPNTAVDHEIRLMLKNSFGFGGLNCVSLIKRYNT